MRKVLTAEQMREVDRLTTERYGIPSIELMENAASAVARVVTVKLGGLIKGRSILILSGKGNNGGDGAALARILWNDGADVSVFLFGKIAEIRGDARANFDLLIQIECEAGRSGGKSYKFCIHQNDENLLSKLTGILETREVDLIVDAMFGTGLTRELSGEYSRIVQKLKDHISKIVSIDLPSGLDADRGFPIGPHVTTAATVTFTAPKAANVLAPSSAFGGELYLADIGSPQKLIDEQASDLFVTEKSDARLWLENAKFTHDSYKNKRGHALLIAGSASYSGAAVLCGNAAMRSGVGLVTVVTPLSSKDSVAARVLPEVMVRGVAETADGSVDGAAFDEIQDLLEKADSVAIGSGLDQNEDTKKFVEKVLSHRQQPTVIDADALNLLSPFDGVANRSKSQFPLILTPHEGEFLRLLGTADKKVLGDRVAAVRGFAARHSVILVLKGERVLMGEPGGRVVVNSTENSGLGKAGNGDTLTGILAGFVAQAVRMEIDIFETVIAAVYVAGLAGDIAEKKYGKRVMTASDVRECLADAFAELET